MLDHSTLDYLKDIESHSNDKAWFDDNRDRYNAVLDDLAGLAKALLDAASDYDPRVARVGADPRDCVSRIHRDMRFNKGRKSRYKNNFFVTLFAESGDAIRPAYYVHVEPGNNYSGGGLYGPSAAQLDGLRTALVDDRSRWHELVDAPSFTRTFPGGITTPESLKVAPRGYDPDDDDIHYLRMKGFAANHPLTRKTIESAACVEEIASSFAAARPLVDFCLQATR